MSAVAAGAARNHVKQKKRHKAELRKHKAELILESEADAKLASEYVSGIVSPAVGTLTEGQCRDVLQHVTKSDQIDDDGLQFFLSHARLEGGTAEDKPLDSAAVLTTIDKYRLYLRKRTYVDTLIAQWDIDNSASLSPEELKALIADKEANLPPSQKREVGGVVLELRPTNEDIDFIMDECDLNKNGVIDKSELLIALASWANIAERKQKKARPASSCEDSGA